MKRTLMRPTLMKQTLMRLGGWMALCGVLLVAAHLGCGLAQMRAAFPVEPDADALFSSTRNVTGLAVSEDGALWAATTGGVLRRSREGVWTKYSRLSGLPSNEARRVQINASGAVEVLLPRARATFQNDKWHIETAAGAPTNAPTPIEIEWNDQIVQAAPDVFRRRPKVAMQWQTVALPNSRGSHVSALLAKNEVLWVALYGDGLYSFDGENWQRLDIALPEDAREITALTFDGNTKTLWLGTRRAGIWQYSLAGWRQHLQSDEPLDHNAQYLAMYDGALWMSTLDDGLMRRTPNGWEALGANTLSSDAPRHLARFQGRLFVRHGEGKVDVFDGKNWSRDVLSAALPRKKAFALTVGAGRLAVAQWGGWSEWNGKVWTHFLKLPELQGLPIMTLLPIDDKLWIGTQSRGVAEYSYKTGKLKWHDERHGLPDDWVTCLAKNGKTLYAGTFVGGLAFFDGKYWKTVKELDGENVTDLKADGQGAMLIATRRGVWRRTADGAMQSLSGEYSWLDREAQALLPTSNGWWIGARTSLAFLKK